MAEVGAAYVRMSVGADGEGRRAKECVDAMSARSDVKGGSRSVRWIRAVIHIVKGTDGHSPKTEGTKPN